MGLRSALVFAGVGGLALTVGALRSRRVRGMRELPALAEAPPFFALE
jgi:hypothetical protein